MRGMKTCATCKHVDPDPIPYKRPGKGYLGACIALPTDVAGGPAFLEDGGGGEYGVWLMVRADFGCVLHEPIESPK